MATRAERKIKRKKTFAKIGGFLKKAAPLVGFAASFVPGGGLAAKIISRLGSSKVGKIVGAIKAASGLIKKDEVKKTLEANNIDPSVDNIEAAMNGLKTAVDNSSTTYVPVTNTTNNKSNYLLIGGGAIGLGLLAWLAIKKK